MGITRPLEERFWEKVDKQGPDECWNWLASTAEGYGQIGVGRRPRRAHQIAWELMVGPRTPGLVIDHLCFNRLCQNPAHMEEVTQGENARRGRARRTPQKLKTHCPHGHAYEGENVIPGPNGARHCRECGRRRMREYGQRKRAQLRAEQGPYVRPRPTHCKHGHPFEGDNLYVDTKGSRRCRTCNRLRAADLRARSRLSHGAITGDPTD